MQVTTSTTRCLPSEIGPLLAGALGAGARVALVSAEDRPESGAIEIAYVLSDAHAATLREFILEIDRSNPRLESMAHLDFSLGRFEREMADQVGVVLVNHPHPARLVKHAHWPESYFPLRHDAPLSPGVLIDDDSYPFLEVEGEGVYEIGVGPVHAGMIEPGHFRFSSVGESIITMKARLWFVHRGVEKLLEGTSFDEAIALVDKVSGDTSIGHSLALSKAIEAALGVAVDPVADLTRQLLLGMEQTYNLIEDIGALANDVAFSIVHSFAGIQKERVLRENRRLTGHRLLRGSIKVGGVELRDQPNPEFFESLGEEMAEIIEILTSHSMAIDRMKGTGVLDRKDAEAIGCVGYVALASGLAFADVGTPGAGESIDTDGERERGDQVKHRLSSSLSGDVASRLEVRLIQLRTTLDDLVAWSSTLAALALVCAPVPVPQVLERRAGVGCVEAWRGRLTHRVVVASGKVVRIKIVDPSFFNWPAVSISLRGQVVADFPLINKSFNLSYAGNDL